MGNIIGPMVYRIDLTSGILPIPIKLNNASSPKQPNRIASNAQHNVVTKCVGCVHGSSGAANNSTPVRTDANNKTWWNLLLVKPESELNNSIDETASACMIRGRNVLVQMVGSML